MCDICIPRRALLGLLTCAPTFAKRANRQNTVEPLFGRATSSDGVKHVALTLDACPGGWDQRIATILVTQQVKATVFLTERWMRANADGLSFLLDHRDLFAFENHGARHVPAILGGGTLYGIGIAGTIENVRREILDGAHAIEAATVKMPSWYRGAAARYSPAAMTLIDELGFRLAAYSLSADQGASLPAREVTRRMVGALNGEVLLGHINQPRRPSGEGIVDGIVALRQVGFSFEHLDQMNPTIARN
jgi:peptidoglycan/xylan/chitin deacetylase (PgdA/CDA1 family)